MKQRFVAQIAMLGLLLAAPLGVAQAADMAVKAPPPMAPPVFDWGGIYVGGSGSWFQSSTHWQYTSPGGAALTPFTDKENQAAWGVHAGAQWQFSQIVLGIEADYTNPASAFLGPASDGTATSVCTMHLGQVCQTRMSGISTLGGRAGWAFGDWLFFGEGGLAVGTIESTLVVPAAGTVFDTARKSDYTNGWYAGGGVNYAVYKTALMDVIIGADYRHIDLGTHLQTSSADGFSTTGANARNIGGTADQVRFTVDIKTNGWNFIGPVVARY
jgi:outer membrane immunogenic protein